MSYTGLGQTCPGQEVFDSDIGVCMCPPGTQTTGTIGVCSSAEVVPGWGEACPVDVPIVKRFTPNCMCPSGTAYDAVKNMCTRAAVHTGGAPSPSVSRSSSDPSRSQAEISTGAAVVAVVAGLGLIYLLSQRG